MVPRIFVIFSIIFLLAVAGQNDLSYSTPQCDNSHFKLGETCQLPDFTEGVCSELIKCDSAKKLFSAKQANKISYCGFHGRQRLVCCQQSSKFTRALCVLDSSQSSPGLSFKITNGDEVAAGEIPFQAALGRRNLDGTMLFNCGGSILADNIILSAAHCFNRKAQAPQMVRLGRVALNLTDASDDNEAVDVDIAEVKVHPQYSSRSRHHDIALLRLKTPIKYTNEIKPVCLASNDTKVPKDLTVTGFGSTDSGRSSGSALSMRLLRGTVKSFPFDDCKNVYRAQGQELIDGQYCAVSHEGMDACQGDSGGPLSFLHTNGALYQYGVISYGAGCGGDFPAIYTKVDKYLDWIAAEMLKFENGQ